MGSGARRECRSSAASYRPRLRRQHRRDRRHERHAEGVPGVLRQPMDRWRRPERRGHLPAEPVHWSRHGRRALVGHDDAVLRRSDRAQGATTCNTANTPHVGYPSVGALAGVWFDTAAPSPSSATISQLAQEAVNAAAHFGNTTAASNRYAQYVVVSPSGTHPDGFGSANFCAWHSYTTSSYGDLPYTNMPYVTDLGASCGENFA